MPKSRQKRKHSDVQTIDQALAVVTAAQATHPFTGQDLGKLKKLHKDLERAIELLQRSRACAKDVSVAKKLKLQIKEILEPPRTAPRLITSNESSTSAGVDEVVLEGAEQQVA